MVKEILDPFKLFMQLPCISQDTQLFWASSTLWPLLHTNIWYFSSSHHYHHLNPKTTCQNNWQVTTPRKTQTVSTTAEFTLYFFFNRLKCYWCVRNPSRDHCLSLLRWLCHLLMTLANTTISEDNGKALTEAAENIQCNHKLLAFIKHSIVKDLNSELCWVMH